MRLAMIAAVVAALGWGTPTLAQTAPTVHQREMAQRVIDLSTGTSLEKLVEEQAEIAMASMGELPAAEAAWVRANMPRMLRRMVDTMLADMAVAYAEVFSEAELEAQIAFYESPLGPSIANKTMQLGVRQQAILGEAIQAYVEEFTNKYCDRFDCSAAAAGKAGRR